MEKVATDIYTFSRLREDGFTYVDKTRELYSMASGEWGAQFFMARPRRFGKSLAVSTLRSLFEGRRDLFQGLAATGFSMQYYHDSRPASGAEHLCSHAWEMYDLKKDGVNP